MNKLYLNKPVLVLLYGFPGSGKTHFARQFCDSFHAAHVQGDRIRYELFDEPKYNKEEDDIVNHLMMYMTEEFLRLGVSVVFDTDVIRSSHRRDMRDVASRLKADNLMIWLQIDVESAFTRVVKRDRRKVDDKFTRTLDRTTFDRLASGMQNPKSEDYVVVSGKHTFTTQKNAIIKKLYDKGLITADESKSDLLAKPELVNLVPGNRNSSAGRRNIFIR